MEYYDWMDQDEDGKLDEWEANGIWNDSRAGWNYFDPTIQEFMVKFEQADTNNDGQISA